MELAKIGLDGYILIVRYDNDSSYDRSRIEEYKSEGFLEFVGSEQPQADTGFVAVDSFEEIDGKLYQSWSIKQDSLFIEHQIDELKSQLESTDYKITKSMEAILIAEPLPYDISTLHAERQATRDKINELEQLLVEQQ